MDRTNWVRFTIPAYQVDIVRLRRYLDDIYHENYELSLENDVFLILAPRELYDGERKVLAEASQYQRIVKENNAIKATMKETPFFFQANRTGARRHSRPTAQVSPQTTTVKPDVPDFVVYSDQVNGLAWRPTIAHDREKRTFPNISYSDGVRVIRFVPAHSLARSHFDTIRLKIEEWTGRPIDWAPLQQPLPNVGAGDYIVAWEWHGVELALALSEDEFDRYILTCFPVTTNNVPLLPLTQQGLKAQQAAKPGSSMQHANLEQPSQSSLGTNVLTANAPPAVQTSVNTKDIYWCIERNFTEPTEIYLSPIQNAETLDDEQLFRQVNKAIDSTEGWVRRLFSWKRCTAIDFVQFLVIWENKDQVNPIQKELPPPATPFYNHSVPLPHDFHMRAAELQMVFGLRDPKKGRGETTIIDMLPKKTNPPPFSKKMSEPGWGLHAKMGFSQRRFLAWLIFCIILGGIFVVFWLIFISKTDLQNVYIPTFLFATILTVALGLLQVA